VIVSLLFQLDSAVEMAGDWGWLMGRLYLGHIAKLRNMKKAKGLGHETRYYL
jgi:hypothetical protein